MKEMLWTVGRFPNGSWTYGGSKKDSVYENCEVFQVMATTGEAAKRKAQGLRSRQLKKAKASTPA